MYTYIDNTMFNSETKEAIKGILGTVLSGGDNDINLNFNDVKTIISDGDVVYVGIGEYKGEKSAEKAIKLALKASTLDISLKVTGILMHFEIHPDFPTIEIAEGIEMLDEKADEDASIIFGATTNNSLNENYVKVSIILAGLKKQSNNKNKLDRILTIRRKIKNGKIHTL